MSQDVQELDPDRYPKLSRWNRDNSYSTEMEAFLSSPTGQLMIDVLRELAIPEQNLANLGSANVTDLQSRLAFMQVLQSGQNLTVENMLALRHAIVLPDQGDLGEWTGGTRVEEQIESQKTI